MTRVFKLFALPLAIGFCLSVSLPSYAADGAVRDKLLAAIFDEDVPKVRAILSKKGVDVKKIQGRWGGNLLLDAAESANYPIGKMLIDRGLSVHTKDPWGNTPLILAVQQAEKPEDYKLVKLLLEKGSDINHANEKGLTAIDVAIRYDQTECLRLLKAYKR